MKKNITQLTLLAFVATMFVFSISNFGCKKKSDDTIDPIVTSTFLRLRALQIETEVPHQVNVIFQVRDKDDIGVEGLTTDKFKFSEDGSYIGSEASATIAPFGNIPVEIKTVLLLDMSISVQNNIDQIKTAAKSLVDKKADYQQISVYSFSGAVTKIIDFSGDKNAIKTAIDNIPLGNSSTNLYGAVIQCAALWTDSYTISKIDAGNLIIFTDGDDTQGSSTLVAAQSAVEFKDVYALGLGNELNVNTLSSLGRYYNASDISKLGEVFLKIQSDIEKTAKSVYYLYYQSPKRGSNEHTLNVSMVTNENTDSDASFTQKFNSSTFVDETGTPPTKPALQTPANNATNQTLGTNLTWQPSTDPDGDPVKYDVYFGTSSSPAKIAGDITATSYTPTVVGNTSYYWKVVVKDNHYNNVTSDIYKFTTGNYVAVTATTNAATNVTGTTATLNGTINANGTTATITFEYGTTESYGQTATATPATVTGNTATSVSANLTGLISGKKYFYLHQKHWDHIIYR